MPPSKLDAEARLDVRLANVATDLAAPSIVADTLGEGGPKQPNIASSRHGTDS